MIDAVIEQFEVERSRAEQDYLELVETLVELGAVKRAPKQA